MNYDLNENLDQLCKKLDVNLGLRHFQTGDLLFHEGSNPVRIFIKSGTVRLFTTDKDGTQVTLSIADDGDLLGFRGIKADPRHNVTAVAMAKTEAYLLPDEAVLDLENDRT